MKLTLSWLKEHLDTSATLAEIVETLTRIGLEVEHVHDPAAQLKAFTIAQIAEEEQHPNADRLRVCKVDTGAGDLVQVVCGAPNARAGLKTVFSAPGTYIPGKKITLGKGVIRGVESLGMMCSFEELDLATESEGIIELPEDAPVGAIYAQWAGLDDPVIEINLTPNRPDAAGVYGVARDLAAAGLGVLKEKDILPVEGKFPCPVGVTLDFTEDDRHLAPFFGLRLVKGVKNGPSPSWLQKRLREIGLRPINALVDITNFLTFDRARPLHVFDANKVKGNLAVRRARAGETLLALDGKTHALDETMVVIADDNGVESIAGVMGGEVSGCSADTTDVLIESALWDPQNIAHTGRKLGIVTDARYRFERGVDADFALPGIELATQLVLQLCGGEASQLVIAGAVPRNARVVDFPWSETQRLAGVDVTQAEATAILERLGFTVEKTGTERANITAPTWRPDIEGKADIVEEIVRIYGVDNVPSTPLPRAEGVAAAVLTLMQKRARNARRALASQGLVEAVTWSFVSKEQAEVFGGGTPGLALANPIAADLSDMRPSLLPGLVAAAHRNAARGLGDQDLFEVGQIFIDPSEKGQRLAAAGIRRGLAGAGRHWSAPAQRAGAFDAKADVMALLGALGVATGGLQVVPGGPAWFHPGRSATLQFGPKAVVGYFGELHPRALKALDVEGPIAAFEIILDVLPAPKAKPTKIKPKLDLSDLQPLSRDFAFIVDRSAPAGNLVKAVAGSDKTLITDVSVFDVYEGVGVPEGKKSVGVAVTLQPREKTLTDAEIEAVAQKIVAEASKKTGATLR
ncbi:phenylalanine--tRNA ligase subunit beta [Methylocystis sp. MJC1]|jgi:phenylalanyl-tRNA synthetase beta chain|uniref:phenylalanine--tRNA ligase subunit beta n=1 Tax=Methylocystis sp. MJC1 TaxID=2654282 RepID=UPI0013EACA57|nr:phenylalanine--tRNA ligase subunit beta [Methylocystis sp. MJC1]KAF2991306.1 Phenylalanine--tRNA ligase beta subunit [Methylocystis sp. MJC1]MBU6526155.1 phenylalanine--tRNA ligase subunit beta [Methylocystis sp. MJC1]UZX12609.1 phenylalanine--tRNA ligase subunit beta [Methylocystis sp. MJC1]